MSALLSDCIDRYLNYRRTAYSSGTALVSDQSMRQFLALVGNIQVKSLAPKHAERFQSDLLQRGLKPNSINSRMSQLSMFSKWAVANRYLPAHIVATVRTIPVPKGSRLRIPVSEFARVLDAASRPDQRATVALGLFMFLRGGEIKSLRVRDIDLDSGLASVVIHKTNDWDEMPICWELDQELRRWFKEYQRDIDRPLHGDDWLVPSHRRFPGWLPRPESGNFQPRVPVLRPFAHVQSVLEQAGYPVTAKDGRKSGEGVHTLRRSGARAYYDALVEGRLGDPAARDDALRQVMAALHHKSVTTTEVYLGLDHDRQKRDRGLKGMHLLPDLTENVAPLRIASDGP